jgi:hypothetical protein
MHHPIRTWVSAAFLAACGLIQTAVAATPAGEVLLLTGRGTATDPSAGAIRELRKGDPVHAGEIINSSINSYVNLKFSDGSYILLRPNTRFVIEDYVDSRAAAVSAPPPAAVAAPAAVPAVIAGTPAPGESSAGSRAFFRLLKGGFRAVSGLIGKADQNEYQVSTPVATIGIRGTDYLVVICDTAWARDPVLRAELPEEVGALEGGIVAGVISGGIGLSTLPQAGAAAPAPVSHAFGWLGIGLLQQGGTLLPGSSAELREGQYAVVTAARKIHPLDQPPKFLIKDPIPNPAALCE